MSELETRSCGKGQPCCTLVGRAFRSNDDCSYHSTLVLKYGIVYVENVGLVLDKMPEKGVVGNCSRYPHSKLGGVGCGTMSAPPYSWNYGIFINTAKNSVQ